MHALKNLNGTRNILEMFDFTRRYLGILGHNVESPGSAARPLVMCPNGTIISKKNLSVLESAIVFHVFFLDFLKKRCPKSAETAG